MSLPSFDPTAGSNYAGVMRDLSTYGMTCYTQGLADMRTADQAQIADLQQQIADLKNPPAFTEDWVDLSQWGTYNGAGSYAAQGVRLSSNVEIVSGAEPFNFCRVWARPVVAAQTIGGHTLSPGDFAAGGIYPTNGKFGPGHSWSMKVRMSAPADGTRGVFMLWGDDSGSVKWPASGELDFCEAGAARADRQSFTITNHYQNASGGNGQSQIVDVEDLTAWCDVEVVWATDNSRLDVWIDSQHSAAFTSNLPPGAASFRFQTALEGGGQSPTYQGAPRRASYIDCGPVVVRAL